MCTDKQGYAMRVSKIYGELDWTFALVTEVCKKGGWLVGILFTSKKASH